MVYSHTGASSNLHNNLIVGMAIYIQTRYRRAHRMQQPTTFMRRLFAKVGPYRKRDSNVAVLISPIV